MPLYHHRHIIAEDGTRSVVRWQDLFSGSRRAHARNARHCPSASLTRGMGSQTGRCTRFSSTYPGCACGGSALPASQVSRNTSTLFACSGAGREDTAGAARSLKPSGVPSGREKCSLAHTPLLAVGCAAGGALI